MADRLSLQDLFEELLGSRNVYFNPPESLKIAYPAIRYTLKNLQKVNANNNIYKLNALYECTLIDYDADSEHVNKILNLPYCSFSQYYKADGLHHWVFNLYHN